MPFGINNQWPAGSTPSGTQTFNQTCSYVIPDLLSQCPKPAYSVFYFNQSSREFDKEKDTAYLLGKDPVTGSSTGGLLSSILSGKNYTVTSDVASASSGTELIWSTLYVK
jgi:hypothetical protein